MKQSLVCLCWDCQIDPVWHFVQCDVLLFLRVGEYFPLYVFWTVSQDWVRHLVVRPGGKRVDEFQTGWESYVCEEAGINAETRKMVADTYVSRLRKQEKSEWTIESL